MTLSEPLAEFTDHVSRDDVRASLDRVIDEMVAASQLADDSDCTQIAARLRTRLREFRELRMSAR